MSENQDNMRIWDAVSKTNPAHTKTVNQRGGFTSICAQYQIMRATETFGPVGIGWGYINGAPIYHDNLVTVPVTIWTGSRENTFGPIFGGDEWKDGKGRVNPDAAKSAGTDGLTKGLSHLGFSADVFLGLYDDNRYVAALKREFSDNQAAPKERPAPQQVEKPKNPELLKTAIMGVEMADDADNLAIWWRNNAKAMQDILAADEFAELTAKKDKRKAFFEQAKAA